MPVPRRRPPDRHGGDGRPRRSRGGSAGHGPSRIPPEKPDEGRHLSAFVARRYAVRRPQPQPVADQARRHDGLCGVAVGAETATAPRRPSRHRLCELHRADQPVTLHVRHRWRTHLGAGRLHRAHRSGRIGGGGNWRHRTRPGDGGDHPPDRRRSRRRADRHGAGDHRRYLDDTLWGRHLGLSRRRHRR